MEKNSPVAESRRSASSADPSIRSKLSGLASLTKNDWLVWSFVCFDLLVVFPMILLGFGVRIGIWYVLVAAILGNVAIAVLARRRAAINCK